MKARNDEKVTGDSVCAFKTVLFEGDALPSASKRKEHVHNLENGGRMKARSLNCH